MGVVMNRITSFLLWGLAGAVAFGAVALMGTPVRAEVKEVRLAKQFGVSYLPLIVMEQHGLIEKKARAAGLGDVKTTWARFSSGAVMNDALLSDNVDFASGGVGPLVKIWAATKGRLNVKGVSAINSMPLFLNTNNPKVKSLRDFTENDRIALPAVKVSIQAVTLQMGVEQVFGAGHYDKLDHLTVSMKHPDGMAALISGTEITAHFTSPPFMFQELENPKVHTVTTSFDILGGPATFNVVWATERFRKSNPRTYAAVYAALEEAMDIIAKDKRAAAALYVKSTKSKLAVDSVARMISDPSVHYTTTPLNTMKYANFMRKVGAIKVKPDNWQELFFDNVRNLKGS